MGNLLNTYCKKRNIVLHKEEKVHILLTLFWNRVLLFRLHLHKWLHGIRHPVVHCYVICWNEERMLPFMLDYYEGFVDYITIYDNYSDDHSEEIVKSYKNTSIIKFSMNGKIDDRVYLQIKNNCWKHSRGKADYVIMCDVDEFIFHEDIHKTLEMLKTQSFSIVKPFGYNMYSTEYPNHLIGTLITQQVKRGVREPMFDKCVLFDPHAIAEINYKEGAHECHPTGRVKAYRNEDVKLLHYKNIGLEQLIKRYRLYASRLSQENIENKLGIEYLKKEQLIIQDFKENEQNAIEII